MIPAVNALNLNEILASIARAALEITGEYENAVRTSSALQALRDRTVSPEAFQSALETLSDRGWIEAEFGETDPIVNVTDLGAEYLPLSITNPPRTLNVSADELEVVIAALRYFNTHTEENARRGYLAAARTVAGSALKTEAIDKLVRRIRFESSEQ